MTNIERVLELVSDNSTLEVIRQLIDRNKIYYTLKRKINDYLEEHKNQNDVVLHVSNEFNKIKYDVIVLSLIYFIKNNEVIFTQEEKILNISILRLREILTYMENDLFEPWFKIVVGIINNELFDYDVFEETFRNVFNFKGTRC